MHEAESEDNSGSRIERILKKYSPTDIEVSHTKPVVRRNLVVESARNEMRPSSVYVDNLQNVANEIKIIEDGLKKFISEKSQKETTVDVVQTGTRDVEYGRIGRLLVSVGLKKQETEPYNYTTPVTKMVKRDISEIELSEFPKMIDMYIQGLKGFNGNLKSTVKEVREFVDGLVTKNEQYSDQLHHDRLDYNEYIGKNLDVQKDLDEIVGMYESMSKLDPKYATVEIQAERMSLGLRRGQGQELKLSNRIKIAERFQKILKSYKNLTEFFAERGDNMSDVVEVFADGAESMEIAVHNVSSICSGVAKVVKSMSVIVESIEEGNRVLLGYGNLISNHDSKEKPVWEAEYQELQQAETVYKKNEEHRLEEIRQNKDQFMKDVRAKALPYNPAK